MATKDVLMRKSDAARLTALIAAALLAATTVCRALSAEEVPAQADLSSLFPPDVRNQCGVAACHDFASVALLEAAIKRGTGRELRLSEADLFVRGLLENKAPQYNLSLGRDQRNMPRLDFEQAEGGDPRRDIQEALKNGVALEQTVPWERFLEAYERFKDERRRDCLAAYYRDATDFGLDAANAKSPAACLRQNGSLAQFFQALPAAKDRAEKLLLGEDPRIEEDRRMVKDLAKGYSLASRLFDLSRIDAALNPARCLQEGQDRGAVILKHLGREKRPVGLTMFFLVDNKPVFHAFVVTGYETSEDGRLTLSTRNSWGQGSVLRIEDRQFCLISMIYWIKP